MGIIKKILSVSFKSLIGIIGMILKLVCEATSFFSSAFVILGLILSMFGKLIIALFLFSFMSTTIYGAVFHADSTERFWFTLAGILMFLCGQFVIWVAGSGREVIYEFGDILVDYSLGRITFRNKNSNYIDYDDRF